MENDATVLDRFHPAVRRWFRESFAAPTPAQRLAWPPIARGESTLLLAPTGSGKTLAAFLFAIHDLVVLPRDEGGPRGVHTLYLSPLKALAADIERNLEAPLAGISRAAQSLGIELREPTVGVRTGDTPPADRARMLRRPPDILVTTPESLHLLLTSARASETLTQVRYVIVDEIHAVCETKRGTFLSLLLERLEDLVGRPLVRIGLSATQRPLDVVARFLGGYDDEGEPRPVTIVDAGMRKGLDLQVVSPVEDMTDLKVEEGKGPSIWPSIYERLLDWIGEHRSTLIFANSRRTVEKIAGALNERAGHPLVRAHHGSVAKERRREIEEDLKAGRLPALVATGSLELGIDMGAIDLVCQVESTHSVARALQRVGRAGHLYHAESVGRLLPKTRADLLEMAALARAMRRGEISPVHIPEGPLDVLAQQVAAAVAVREWSVEGLFRLVRRAAPYRALRREAFLSVLSLLAGGETPTPLSPVRPRISWDRTKDVLYPLPGTRRLVVTNGGAIPDTGQYAVVLADGVTRVGEFDEEFIYESREGDTVVLGTRCWKILDIGADRVTVAPAEEEVARAPFWRGEGLGRDAPFGRAVGELLRECEGRLSDPSFEAWLSAECALDAAAARNLRRYLLDQGEKGAPFPTDRTILLDSFRDDLGEARLAILSPLGRSFHLALLFLLQASFRRRGGPLPQAAHADTGILLKPGSWSPEAVLEVLCSLRGEDVREAVAEEIEGSPLFGASFRKNATRALLLPRLAPGRRTPLWLQRLRARDLLELARTSPSFPIVAETYREVLDDLLPLADLAAFLDAVGRGEARFVLRRADRPSPFASSLLFDFTAAYLYEWNEPKLLAGPSRVDREVVLSLAAREGEAKPLFDLEAIATMEERLQGLSPADRARDGSEIVELLRRIGDLTEEELALRAEPSALASLPDLLADGRIGRVRLPSTAAPSRLVVGDDLPRYAAFDNEGATAILRRAVASHSALSEEELLARYPLSSERLARVLERIDVVRIERPDGATGLVDADVARGIRRLTLSRRRARARPVPPSAFALLLLDLQHVHRPLEGLEGLREVLSQLAGLYLPVEAWPGVLARRIAGYRPVLLDTLLRNGEFAWRGVGSSEGSRRVSFERRGEPLPAPPSAEAPHEEAARVAQALEERGALFLNEVALAAGLVPSHAARGLWNLICQGRATNDSLAPFLSGPPEEDLWRGSRAKGWAGGRFSLLARPSDGESEDETERLARLLLGRHGLVAREVLALESIPLVWTRLYPALARLEWRGAVDRAPFLSGLSGPQFLLPKLVDRLACPMPSDELLLLPACDPANPYGPGAVFPVQDLRGEAVSLRWIPSSYLILRGGVPLLAVASRGERLVPVADLDPGERRRALALLPRILRDASRPGPIRVKTWDGAPAAASLAAADLAAIGFSREDEEMIYYRRYEPGT